MEFQFPPKLKCLFQPKRYKVLWGGRGAGRSWGVARKLLIQGIQQPIRVLCARELQNSIAESVHRVLADQIELMGLQEYYDVQRERIIGRHLGTTFAFEGIKNNVTKIKSYEGIDICWVEEAIKVSKGSWNVLIPTIRKTGSEIWLTFNPDLETDYTYQNFVVDADPTTTVVCHMTWRDNPWFPQVLQAEMEKLRKKDFDAYLNIWEGRCIQILEGVVYAKQLRQAQLEGRICTVPYDRSVGVSTFWDLGRGDATAIWFAQRVAMQNRILHYYEATGEDDVTHFLRYCQSLGYVYDTFYLPHDAKAKRLGTKNTIEEVIRAAGFRVQIVPKLSVPDGMNAAKMLFPNAYFDESGTRDGLLALRNYRYKVVDGHYSNDPIHDWASDGADAFRYMAIALRGPRVEKSVVVSLEEAREKSVVKKELDLRDSSGRSSGSGLGWMRV